MKQENYSIFCSFAKEVSSKLQSYKNEFTKINFTYLLKNMADHVFELLDTYTSNIYLF